VFVRWESLWFVNKRSLPARRSFGGSLVFQTVRPYQKNNLFFNLDGDYVSSTGYAQIRAKGDHQFLQYQPLVNLVIRRSTGSNYPAISPTDLKEIAIKVPKIMEQKKIGSFLQMLDLKISSIGTKLTQIQTFKKGLLQQMFV
jgi:type I restriction enzyme S subunit